MYQIGGSLVEREEGVGEFAGCWGVFFCLIAVEFGSVRVSGAEERLRFTIPTSLFFFLSFFFAMCRR